MVIYIFQKSLIYFSNFEAFKRNVRNKNYTLEENHTSKCRTVNIDMNKCANKPFNSYSIQIDQLYTNKNDMCVLKCVIMRGEGIFNVKYEVRERKRRQNKFFSLKITIIVLSSGLQCTKTIKKEERNI